MPRLRGSRGNRTIALLATAAAAIVAVGMVSAEIGRASPDPAAPDPADFVAGIDNAWFPLQPGTVFTYRGVKDGQAQRNVVEITSRTKVIQGVTCEVVDDNVIT